MRLSGWLVALLAWSAVPAFAAVHVWEKQELTFTSARSFSNPYTEVTVWVDLAGPGFKKRVYGFWDGGRTFHVRVLATAPGTWTWRSGSTPPDAGLAGKSGSFTAAPWTEEEKQQNTLRRGFLRPTANRHALEQADGTPFFVIGDTWYATGTNRFKLQWRRGHPAACRGRRSRASVLGRRQLCSTVLLDSDVGEAAPGVDSHSASCSSAEGRHSAGARGRKRHHQSVQEVRSSGNSEPT